MPEDSDTEQSSHHGLRRPYPQAYECSPCPQYPVVGGRAQEPGPCVRSPPLLQSPTSYVYLVLNGCLFRKANRLEVWSVEADAATLLHSKTIYGTISVLQRLRPKGSKADLLFVGTERLEYFTMLWNAARRQLETRQCLHDQGEPHMREAECQNRCVVDPSGRFMVLHVWDGVINISRLKDRGDSRDDIMFLEQVRVTELAIKSSTFLYSHTGPRIAFLYRTRGDEEDSKLAIYRVTADDRHLHAAKFDPKRDRQLDMAVNDPLARMLIPVPIVEDVSKRHHVRHASTRKAHLGGILVVGETSVLYVDSQDDHNYITDEYPLAEGNIFVAWDAYDATHYFLADDFGRINLLTIVTDGVVVTGVEVSRLGNVVTSKASTLVYMGDGILFVGSHHGDSQLLRVDVESRTASFLDDSPAFSNNAPILDFVIMDMGDTSGGGQTGNTFSSGKTRLVAGCGALESGSLRSIRSGVGLEDLGILDDFENVRGLFTLKSHGADKVDTLLVSSIIDTRVFRFDAVGEIEEAGSFQGLKLDCQTLLASNLPNGQLLQVTPEAATLLDPESGVTLLSWSPSEDAGDGAALITDASANDSWALLSVNGTTLVSLNLRDNLKAVSKALSPGTGVAKEDQISCLHASPAITNVGVVGFWKSVSVTLCDLETLTPLRGEDIPQTEDSAAVPRDAVLVQLHPPGTSGPTLLVAMDDGNVVTYQVSKEDMSLSGRKSVGLGTRQARLHVLPGVEGVSRVFATTEHSSLIHSSEGRIAYSATTAQDAIYVAPFDSEAFPECVAIAGSTSLKISQLDTVARTQVNTFPFGKTVRRIAYSPTAKAFVLCCINRTVSAGVEILSTEVCLVNEVTFEIIGEPFPLPDAKGLEIPECMLRVARTDSEDSDDTLERFIIGTSIVEDPAKGTSGGRILVLGIDNERKLQVAASHSLNGACHCLAPMDTDPNGRHFRIVAGLSASVVVYDYGEASNMDGVLYKVGQYRSTTCPQDISVHGNVIAVADIIKSLTILELRPRTEDGSPPKLVERARHLQQVWTTAVDHLGENFWLQTDANGHVMVLREKTDAAASQDRKRMELTSIMNLGEQVNQIRHLNIAPDENAIVWPKAFLGTVRSPVRLCFTRC